MKYDLIIVRFGEIVIKGRNRHRFERSLLNQMRAALGDFLQLQWVKSYARVYIYLNGEDYEAVAERLKEVFGIINFSPAIASALTLFTISEKAFHLIAGSTQKDGTFKITTRRANKQFVYSTLELNKLVGEYVLQNRSDLKVNLHQPDVNLKIDVQRDQAYLYYKTEKGAGGFPYGMNGKAMLLLSGGIDGPVAGWMAMRKGLALEVVHFHSYPYTSVQAKEKVYSLCQKLSAFGGEIKLHLVPFADVQLKIQQIQYPSLAIIFMRRQMLRIAEKLAHQHKALALVTGESLGQVASQTLASLNVIGRVTNLPILRPLITLDKQDIVDWAKRIGTYATSILPYEDCCTLFVPESPAINPQVHVVRQLEEKTEQEFAILIKKAVNNTEIISFKNAKIVETNPQKKIRFFEDVWF